MMAYTISSAKNRIARERVMRLSVVFVAIAGLMMASPAAAQDWFLYESEVDQFDLLFAVGEGHQRAHLYGDG